MLVIYVLCDCGKFLFLDIYKLVVMCEVLVVEVDMINDINGFCVEGVIDVVKDSEVGLCVMYM